MPEATSLQQGPSEESRNSTNATCHAVPKSSATVPLIMDALPEQSLFEEVGSSPTTSPADSVLMAASDQECPSHQAANLMLRAPATSNLT
ncbi:hypothetical protein V5799_024469 [Amblyomma americanum]|uniref:Uncharacterized protein n=1 Tax=Amblyomma americanum TaxID=6943 RepID=A0AAQ4ECH5_AMBAM